MVTAFSNSERKFIKAGFIYIEEDRFQCPAYNFKKTARVAMAGSINLKKRIGYDGRIKSRKRAVINKKWSIIQTTQLLRGA
jgi:hypothetical protein